MKHCRISLALRNLRAAFSILERIDVGETHHEAFLIEQEYPFSILERIDVGETIGATTVTMCPRIFQYPRTDRRG